VRIDQATPAGVNADAARRPPSNGHEANYLRGYMAELCRELENDPARRRHMIADRDCGNGS
jgi:hypothetical protein